MLISATQTKDRYTVCESCQKGFMTTQAKYYSCAEHVCDDCEYKRLRLRLLYEELRSAGPLGHTECPCELCRIQNQIDDLVTGGYDWREEYERRTRQFDS